MYKAHVKLSKAKKRALKNMAPVNDLLLENRSQQETDIAVDPSILKNCNEALMSQLFVHILQISFVHFLHFNQISYIVYEKKYFKPMVNKIFILSLFSTESTHRALLTGSPTCSKVTPTSSLASTPSCPRGTRSRSRPMRSASTSLDSRPCVSPPTHRSCSPRPR